MEKKKMETSSNRAGKVLLTAMLSAGLVVSGASLAAGWLGPGG
jgi:hypothetical protein